MKTNNAKIEIQIKGRIPAGFSESAIKGIIKKILNSGKFTAESIGIAFVTVDKIVSLNQTYRKINKPTDILSFAYHESKNPRQNIEGDIIICPKYVKDDLIGTDIDFTTQIKRLLIHGILHLAGYDHAKDVDEKKMFALQEKLLNDL